ncbi:MAG TPA: class I SAM-dependent methyltransferase [Pyrinomonadaceae bacterium]|jgi:ubiquinone/menaquinone biosynthesis C-methylase UbiE|nr:class I SAM-dependent methyltransferase [Pyrinomonadaceae bacterium]
MSSNVILILYTTKYRLGGEQFPVVAETLTAEKRAGLDDEVVVRAVESKRDVFQAIAEIKKARKRIAEFIFVGHSGMYGPMYGTAAFPEQFSPYEWEQMDMPFAEKATAYFYCCRSARWFAPFFARTFGVETYGFFWYTTFSRSKDKYVAAGNSTAAPLYTIGCKGRKSHGLLGATQKRLGFMPAEEMKRFEPQPPDGDTSYDHVAELYDAVFEDIRVRKDEWRWLNARMPSGEIDVLDIGCGNGALLNALSGKISTGVGVDESAGMIEKARRRNSTIENLRFEKIDGPSLPFPDNSFDVVTSLMSFRYLDWDPLLAEIKRVTRPGGKFLVVDMVTVPVAIRDYPQLIGDKLRTIRDRKANAKFDGALQRLVSHPDWKKMVEYNPIRSEHEMKWYLESRFPGQKMEILNMAWHSRIVAFDSGPVEAGVEAKLTFP